MPDRLVGGAPLPPPGFDIRQLTCHFSIGRFFSFQSFLPPSFLFLFFDLVWGRGGSLCSPRCSQWHHTIVSYVLPKVKFSYYLFIYLSIYINILLKGGQREINTHVLLFWGVPNVSKNICDGPIAVQNFGCNPPPNYVFNRNTNRPRYLNLKP